MRGQRDYLAARVLELEQAAEDTAKEKAELLAKLESSGGGGGGGGGDGHKFKIRVAELEGSNKLLATKVQETEMKLDNARTETENLRMEVEKAAHATPKPIPPRH